MLSADPSHFLKALDDPGTRYLKAIVIGLEFLFYLPEMKLENWLI